VIIIDSDAPDSKRLFFIGTNNYQAGLTGGERLAAELKGKGNVVVLPCRRQTNMAETPARLPLCPGEPPSNQNRRVVDIAGDPRIVFDTTTEILGKERDKVDAFVCLEAQGGKEVANVLSSNKVTGKIVIAMDTDRTPWSGFRKGVIAATISQKPYTMTYFGLRVLDDCITTNFLSLTGDFFQKTASLPCLLSSIPVLRWWNRSNVENFIQMKRRRRAVRNRGTRKYIRGCTGRAKPRARAYRRRR